jgi:hypothetical protein
MSFYFLGIEMKILSSFLGISSKVNFEEEEKKKWKRDREKGVYRFLCGSGFNLCPDL